MYLSLDMLVLCVYVDAQQSLMFTLIQQSRMTIVTTTLVVCSVHLSIYQRHTGS